MALLLEEKPISYSVGVGISEEQSVKGERCCAECIQRDVLILFIASKV